MEHATYLKSIQHLNMRGHNQVHDKANEFGKLAARRAGIPSKTSKPALEIYRPPSESNTTLKSRDSLRLSGDIANYPVPTSPGVVHFFQGPNNMISAPHYEIHRSSSSTKVFANSNQASSIGSSSVTASTMSPLAPVFIPSSTKLTRNSSTARVHFQLKNDNNDASINSGSKFGALKRSKSLGAGDMKTKFSSVNPDFDVGEYPHDIQILIQTAIDDGSRLTSRQLMELVKHIFNRALETVKNAEPAAKLCGAIADKDSQGTFLDTLLNSVRQWYHERDKNLGESGFATPRDGGQQRNRWVAFSTFLCQLHSRLKSHRRSVAGANNTQPSVMLLNLLCQCCLLFLKPQHLDNPSEIECLFCILMNIGREMENDMPDQFYILNDSLRDAFIYKAASQTIRKTLLQLLELRASKWQLPASAVMYYYPTAS